MENVPSVPLHRAAALRCPFESLSRAFRQSQKSIDRTLAATMEDVDALALGDGAPHGSAVLAVRLKLESLLDGLAAAKTEVRRQGPNQVCRSIQLSAIWLAWGSTGAAIAAALRS